jgi:hypothetical protein
MIKINIKNPQEKPKNSLNLIVTHLFLMLFSRQLGSAFLNQNLVELKRGDFYGNKSCGR